MEDFQSPPKEDLQIKQIDNFRQFSKEFVLQEEISKLAKQPIVFFDTSLLVDMIAGLKAFSYYEGEGGLRWELYEMESCLLGGFVYRGWVGGIHLFPPHLHELLNKINNRPSFFPPYIHQQEEKELRDELWEKKDLISRIFNPRSEEDKDPKLLATRIKYSVEDLFKGHFLSHELKWRARFRQLQNNGLLQLPKDEDYIVAEIEGSSLYQEVLKRLGQLRTHSFNNYLDALALCMLNEKFKAFKADPQNQPLPIFHSSQKDIYTVVEALSQDEKYGFPFCYTSKDTGLKFLIVQNNRFFIDYAVFKKYRENKLKFLEILEKYGKVADNQSGITDQMLPSGKWKSYTRDAYHLAFLALWWETSGFDEYQELKQLRTEEKSRRQVLKTEIQLAEFWNKEQVSLERTLLPYTKRIHLANVCLRKLTALEDNIRQVFKDREMFSRLNIYDEVGIRFHFPKKVCESAQKTLKDLYDAIVHRHAERDFGIKVTDLVVQLVDSALDPSLSKESSHKLGKVLSICWVVKEYELIDLVCKENREMFILKKHKDKYPGYPIALLHAAAILAGRSEDRLQRCQQILDCVEEKYGLKNGESHHAHIALALLYFRLWFELKYYPSTVPELIPENNRKKILESQAYKHLHTALDYAQKALTWLEKNLKTEPEKEESRREKIFYAQNIVLYFSTLCSPTEEFLTQQELANEFEASKDTPYWQGRFADTLAWFYFRLALVSPLPDQRKLHLETARQFNHRSLLKSQTIDALERFEDLGRLIASNTHLVEMEPTHLSLSPTLVEEAV